MLLTGRWIDFPQCRPKPHRSVACDHTPRPIQGIRQIGAILHAKAVSATVVKPFGFATGDGEGSRCGIRTRIALQNPVAQVVVAILWGHGPFAIPGQGGMLIGYARVSTQETREQSPEKRRRTPLTTFWAAETQLGEPPHCVRSRLREMQAPQRSSETPRLACKITPICLIPYHRHRTQAPHPPPDPPGELPGARHRRRSRPARSPHQGTRCILRTGAGSRTVRSA